MIFAKLKGWAKKIKLDVLALWIAARDPRTPWFAKAVAATVAAYALSPIDLIPDFIPVIGYLDDLIIVPLGILFALKLIPPNLMLEFRVKAIEVASRPASKVAAILFVVIWCACAVVLLRWFALKA